MGDAVDKAKRPVAMVPDMVLAILDGSKTQTRRLVRAGREADPGNVWYRCICREVDPSDTPCDVCLARFGTAPLGYPGDLLWVRERARVIAAEGFGGFGGHPRVQLEYEADGTTSPWLDYPARLKPPKFGHCIANGCFREASRITLEVLRVWTERLGYISEEDARAEGFESRAAFFATWDSIYSGRGRNADPMVWVTEFRRVGSEVHGGK